MSDEGATVIRLPGATPYEVDARRRRAEVEATLPAIVQEKDHANDRYCGHHKVSLDKKRRVVLCRCGQVIDPFDFVVKLAHGWEDEMRQLQAARKEAELLRDDIARLKRDEANTKARLRTARKALASLPPGEGEY